MKLGTRERRCLKAALDVVMQHEKSDMNEAVKFQTMCDKLQAKFKDIPDKFIAAAIEFYCEYKRLI